MGLPALGIGAPGMDAMAAAGGRGLPALALHAAWPVCLRATGLLPLTPVGEDEDAQAGRPLYRLYGMYLAVLSARRAAEAAVRLGGDAASTVFGPARGHGLDSRRGYGWEQPADGPLRPTPARDPCSYRKAL